MFEDNARRVYPRLDARSTEGDTDGPAAAHLRLRRLRPHPRARGGHGPPRRDRPDLPAAAGRGDVLPDAPAPGVRRRRDVAVLLRQVARPRRAAVRGPAGVHVPAVPARGHLRARRRRHREARGPAGQGGRHAGVAADRERLDPRHPRRPLRGAGRLGRVPHRRAGDAGAGREGRGRPRRAHPDLSRSRRARPSRRCWPTARSTPSRARGCRRPSCRAGSRAAAVPRPRRRGEAVLRRHRDLPDHARRRRAPGRLRAAPVGGAVADQGAGTWPSRRRWPSCTTPRRCGSCCRG